MPAEPLLPLLRSPPFPGVPPLVAAVSAIGGHLAPLPADDDRIETMLALVRAAAVGGAFWGKPATDRAATIVRYRRADDRRLLARGAPAGASWIATATDRREAIDPLVAAVARRHADGAWRRRMERDRGADRG